MQTSTERIERLIAVGARWFIVLLIVVDLSAQLSSLYQFPMPDSARWWGDETGQILELRTELSEGHARIPIAHGATVGITNGLLRGNSWLAAAIYGTPALLFGEGFDLVSIGRTVTAILALLLLATLFLTLRRLGVPEILSLLAVLVMVANRSFFFASHAARLDVAAGLAALLTIGYLASRHQRSTEGTWKPSTGWWFCFGIGMLLEATLSIHLLTLLAPIAIYTMVKLGGFKRPTHTLAAIAGLMALAILLLGIYALSGAPISILGPTSQHTQFASVIEAIPITKLFSRSAQVSNLVQRWQGMVREAPSILLLVIGAVTIATAFRLSPRRNAKGFLPDQSFFIVATVWLLLAWLLFESYAIYYYVQILPALLAVAFILITNMSVGIKRQVMIPAFAIVIAAAVGHFAFYDALAARAAGRELTRNNEAALSKMFATENFQRHATVVVAQNPALAWMLHRTSATVMSEHFLEFPLDASSPAEVLRREHAEFILLYSDPDDPNYATEYQPLKRVADSIGVQVSTSSGQLMDVGRSYFTPISTRVDTLRLYRLQW